VSDPLFLELTRIPIEGAAITRAAAAGAFLNSVPIDRIAETCGLADARWPQIELVIRALVTHRVATVDGRELRVSPAARTTIRDLSIRLQAVADYLRFAHEDTSSASIVVTHPPSPSEFSAALRASGFGAHGIAGTEDALTTLAHNARERLVSVTPFVDDAGMELWLRLLRLMDTNCVASLMIRKTTSHDSLTIVKRYQGELSQHRCEVREFIPYRVDTARETFHAKVVLQDSVAAYVGSANLTGTSINYSLEIGSIVYGKAARTIVAIVDAMHRCSTVVLKRIPS
jgi:hypothetical protein